MYFNKKPSTAVPRRGMKITAFSPNGQISDSRKRKKSRFCWLDRLFLRICFITYAKICATRRKAVLLQCVVSRNSFSYPKTNYIKHLIEFTLKKTDAAKRPFLLLIPPLFVQISRSAAKILSYAALRTIGLCPARQQSPVFFPSDDLLRCGAIANVVEDSYLRTIARFARRGVEKPPLIAYSFSPQWRQ